METQSPPAIIFQTLTSSLQHIVAEISQIKADFLGKLHTLSEQSTSVQRLVESMGLRLSKIESFSDDQSFDGSARTPETRLQCRKLETEIRMLKEKVRLLADENALLRCGKPRPYMALKPPAFEASVSDDDHSMSSLQLADRSDLNKANLVPQRIREFRLDSAPSQTFKPNSSLLSDPRVAKILNPPVANSRTVKEVNSLKAGRLPEIEQKLRSLNGQDRAFPALEHTPSLSPARSPAKPRQPQTPSRSPRKQPRQLTVVNRRPVKSIDREKDDIGRTLATSADELSKTLAGIKNFGDFKSLLKQMKDTISLTNYSLFNADVDKNLENLQNLFRDYSELQDKIDDLHLKLSAERPSPRGFLESPDKGSANRDPDAPKAPPSQAGRLSGEALDALNRLRDNVKLSLHKEGIAEVQGNPGHLESFLYRLKAEFDANSREFRRITEGAIIK